MRYEELRELKEKSNIENVGIFGAGLIGATWGYDLLRAMGFHVGFFCDNKKEAGIEIRDGIKTIPLEKLYAMKDNVLVFITLASERNQQDIKDQLVKNGICNIAVIDNFTMQIFIESLLEINDEQLNEQFKCVLDDAEYIAGQFKYVFGYELDFENPKTFNEKINVGKLKNDDPHITRLVDKFLVKDWVREQIGEKHVTKLYGAWDDANDIDFDALPEAFALKLNNGSGKNIIVKNKKDIDRDQVCKQLNVWKKASTAYRTREIQYKNVVPKIICEEYLEGVADDVYDYNVYCFHGEPEYIWCIKGSHKPDCKASFYNKNWEMQPFSYGYPKDPDLAPKPEKLDEMLELSRIMCKGFPHVRVDWYLLPDGRILFGEMTFSTWAGFRHFEPEEYDEILGKLI